MAVRVKRSVDAVWNKRELALLARLNTARKIQDFLDELRYFSEPVYHSPRDVMRDLRADCGDGAIFAAAALRRLGYPPAIVYLGAVRDDDHLMAVFRRGPYWGAVAKSNTVGLRFREPIYRTLRELVLSYFEWYYNLDGEKTLRTYSVPLRLDHFDHLQWMTQNEGLEPMLQRIDRLRRFPVLTPRAVTALQRVDARTFKGGLLGARPEGLYRPSAS